MDEGHPEGSDVTHPLFIHGWARHLDSTQWVRAVENDDFHASLETCLHRIPHATDVGIATNPDVLQVYNQAINVRKHLWSRLAKFPV